jgi:hypothetical protein
LKYEFDVLNAQHLFKATPYDPAPWALRFASKKHGFLVTPLPIHDRSCRLSIEGETEEIVKKVTKMCYEFGLRLAAVGENVLPIVSPGPTQALRELHKEYGMDPPPSAL